MTFRRPSDGHTDGFSDALQTGFKRLQTPFKRATHTSPIPPKVSRPRSGSAKTYKSGASARRGAQVRAIAEQQERSRQASTLEIEDHPSVTIEGDPLARFTWRSR